jgi:DNA-binding response OmpR family regulator
MKNIVYIVDDETSICKLLRIGFERAGYDCLAFSDPRDAYKELFEERKPANIAIIDIHMPYLDGFDFVKTRDQKCPNLPIILICVGHEQEALAAGADGYMDKPFYSEDLINLTRDVLLKKRGRHV